MSSNDYPQISKNLKIALSSREEPGFCFISTICSMSNKTPQALQNCVERKTSGVITNGSSMENIIEGRTGDGRAPFRDIWLPDAVAAGCRARRQLLVGASQRDVKAIRSESIDGCHQNSSKSSVSHESPSPLQVVTYPLRV
jgi:hypothetical protein